MVIAVASAVTTYFFLSSRLGEQPTVNQTPVVPPAQTNIIPTNPPTTQTTVPADETANWKVYKNEDLKYEFSYPSLWILNVIPEDRLSHVNNLKVFLQLFSVPKELNGFIVITVSSLTLQEDMKNFIEANITEEIIKKEDIVFGNNITATKLQTMNKDLGFLRTSIFTENNNLTYHIRLEEGTPNDGKIKSFFEQILSTFKFTN